MSLHMSRRRMPTWVWVTAVAVLAAGAWREAALAMAAQPRAMSLDPERAALMQKHFGQAIALTDSVIRGDLAAVRQAATTLAAQDAPQGLPPVAGPFVAAMKLDARRAAAATSIVSASSAAASMLASCGNCHETVGVRPAFASRDAGSAASPAGVVGHMLEHQRAANLMFEGLVLPSATSWREGALRLSGAQLHERQLPRDSRWTPDIIKAEERLHRFASDALETHDYMTRAASYAQILATCAECHGLHEKVWGPSSR